MQTDTTAGYSERTARSQAHRLLTNVNIQQFINNGKKEIANEFKISRESLVADLIRIREKAEDSMDFSPAIKAIEVAAKMLGLNEPEKVDLNVGGSINIVFNTVSDAEFETD